jgi:hypothetical protein
MNFREFFLGVGEFKSPAEIIKLISRYNKLRDDMDNLSRAEILLIFQTSRQQTWLVVSQMGIYCILDDLNNSFTRVKWFMNKRELVDNREIIADITTRDKTDKTGFLNIGARRNWLFSKMLFLDESIETRIRGLISRIMIG